MKSIWKYVFIGLCVLIFEWIFLAASVSFFSGMGELGGIIVGAAFFLAFEMVICTGIIVSEIKRNK